MASQAEIMRKKIEQYKSRPYYSPEILAAMESRLNYANTVDPDLERQVDKILSND